MRLVRHLLAEASPLLLWLVPRPYRRHSCADPAATNLRSCEQTKAWLEFTFSSIE